MARQCSGVLFVMHGWEEDNVGHRCTDESDGKRKESVEEEIRRPTERAMERGRVCVDLHQVQRSQ